MTETTETVMVKAYVARRRLKIAPGVYREPPMKGDPTAPANLVPEAVLWNRVDSFVHGGFLVEQEVSEAEFRTALDLYVPEGRERGFILDRVGLTDDVILTGPHSSPELPAKKDKAAKKAKKAKKKAKADRQLEGPVPDRRDDRAPVDDDSDEISILDELPDVDPPAESQKLVKRTNTPVLIPLRELDEE